MHNGLSIYQSKYYKT